MCLLNCCTVGPPNKEHFGDNMNSADLFFVERFSSLEGSRCILGIILGPQVMSFVERFIILCPYLGEPAIRGSTASHTLSYTCKKPPNPTPL